MGQQQILLLVVAAIVVGIAISIGVSMFSANAQTANRDSIYSELYNLSTLAIQFYRKPVSNGGGSLTFDAWNIPAKLDTTSNGVYTAACAGQIATITAQGRELGENGSTPIEMIAEVTAAGINISTLN